MVPRLVFAGLPGSMIVNGEPLWNVNPALTCQPPSKARPKTAHAPAEGKLVHAMNLELMRKVDCAAAPFPCYAVGLVLWFRIIGTHCAGSGGTLRVNAFGIGIAGQKIQAVPGCALQTSLKRIVVGNSIGAEDANVAPLLQWPPRLHIPRTRRRRVFRMRAIQVESVRADVANFPDPVCFQFLLNIERPFLRVTWSVILRDVLHQSSRRGGDTMICEGKNPLANVRLGEVRFVV